MAFERLSYANCEFCAALFLRLAAEYISLTLNVSNVNELIWVLETSIKCIGRTSIISMFELC